MVEKAEKSWIVGIAETERNGGKIDAHDGLVLP